MKQRPSYGRIALTTLAIIVALVFAQTLLLPTNIAYANEIVDGDNESPTQRNTMHACPINRFIIGVRIDKNYLACSSDFGAYPIFRGVRQEIIDGDFEAATQRNGMHACPAGMGVTGFQVRYKFVLR